MNPFPKSTMTAVFIDPTHRPQYCEECGADLKKLNRRFELDDETLALAETMGLMCASAFRLNEVHAKPSFSLFLRRFVESELAKAQGHCAPRPTIRPGGTDIEAVE